ncbi:MAG: hypothetical protein HY290_11770, partial [Planctomycetia bacterium]|nr:hypothetical protein [Planctomycetia bacterium]
YEAGYVVELISGFYRSPDVMGLHAANTTMFSALLSIQPRTRYKWLWIAMVLWGTTCLVLSGRRKMIGMLLVFAAIYLSLRIRRTGFARILPFTILVSSVIATVLLVMREGKDTQEYADYAQTTITQGGERLQENLVEGVLVSLRQTGVLGIGLGTATQGRYYVEGLAGTKAWQEDGISRIFAEMGLLGAIFMTLAIVNFIRAAYVAWKMVPIYSPIHEIQIGMLAIVGASIASFIVSHQAFSGDPCALLFVSLLFGVLLSGPIQVVRAMMAAEQQASSVAGQLPRPRVGA